MRALSTRAFSDRAASNRAFSARAFCDRAEEVSPSCARAERGGGAPAFTDCGKSLPTASRCAPAACSTPGAFSFATLRATCSASASVCWNWFADDERSAASAVAGGDFLAVANSTFAAAMPDILPALFFLCQEGSGQAACQTRAHRSARGTIRVSPRRGTPNAWRGRYCATPAVPVAHRPTGPHRPATR